MGPRLGAAALLLAAAACTAAERLPPPPPAAPAAAAPAAPGPERGEAVAIAVADPRERARLEAAVRDAPGLVLAGRPAEAFPAIADAPLPGARPVVLARWAAITDQRRDVLALDLDGVRRILRGEVRDWSELGGSPQPIAAYLPASQAARAAAALGVPPGELAAAALPDGEAVARVAAEPGAFALVPPERLRLGVLALVVEGHDPYRDPARDSPLREARWIRARDAAGAARLAALAGFAAAPAFDPAGLLATGELIPARCTDAALASLGDYGAMFDGVRDAIAAADLAVAPLEISLTDLAPPTPCVRTFVLQGSPRAVGAIAEAGIDVVITAGNHAMDCWGGCPYGAALLDTLARLRAAGVATAGAGADLRAARAPALAEAPTANGPVRFAFLGYDSIAAAFYAAGEDAPGTAPLDEASVREDVAAARALADHVVVAAGWGVEYTADPTPFQRRLGGVAIEAGATLVLGNHPHWVQAVEHFGDEALVAYSFGNFVFDQSWSVETTQGMAMELGFTAERLIGYRIRPVVIRGDGGGPRWIYRPEFVDPAGEGRAILDRVRGAQDRLPARGE